MRETATVTGSMRGALSFTRKLREPVSGLTHLLGVALAITGLVVLVVAAARRGTAWHVVSVSVYGSSTILLYAASSLYHLLPLGPSGIRRLRRFDHSMIFVLIAGTYTPFCLVSLRGPWGWSLFGVVWGVGLAGIVLKSFWLETPRWLTASLYLAMGWIVVVAIPALLENLSGAGLLWMLAGGLCYSGGAFIYATKKPNPWPGVFGFHEIWHLWVLAGSTCHWIAIYKHVLPGA